MGVTIWLLFISASCKKVPCWQTHIYQSLLYTFCTFFRFDGILYNWRLILNTARRNTPSLKSPSTVVMPFLSDHRGTAVQSHWTDFIFGARNLCSFLWIKHTILSIVAFSDFHFVVANKYSFIKVFASIIGLCWGPSIYCPLSFLAPFDPPALKMTSWLLNRAMSLLLRNPIPLGVCALYGRTLTW